MRLACQTNAWGFGAVWGHPVGVTSIKDLWYCSPGATAAAPADIAAAGFEGIEMFDGDIVEFADDLDGLRTLLDQHSLELVGVYSGANLIFPDVIDEEFWRIDRAAGLAAELGAEHLVIGGGAQRAGGVGADDMARLHSGLDRVVEVAELHGLVANYHPHMSTMIESPEQLSAAFAGTSIRFCPDTAHVALGGGDPTKVIREHADRIDYVHIKDLSADGAFVPVGEGVLDIEAIAGALGEIDFDGWVTVEFDGFAGDLAAAASESRRRVADLLERAFAT